MDAVQTTHLGMQDLDRHDRSAEPVIEDAAADDAQAAIDAALRMHHHPGDTELARLTDRLISHCTDLAAALAEIPEDERPARGTSALEYWAGLRDSGPSDGAMANWSYARQMACVARDMLTATRGHAAVRRRVDGAFVGREALPLLAPGRP